MESQLEQTFSHCTAYCIDDGDGMVWCGFINHFAAKDAMIKEKHTNYKA